MMSTDYTLSCGTHATPKEGRCAMEWVSHLAGEPHSAEPACVSPVLRAFCASLDDGLEDIPRQQLRRYLPRTIGTSRDGLDDQRGWMAMDWLIRVHTPTRLSVAGLTGAGERLRSFSAVSDVDDLTVALVELRFARQLARGACGTGAGAWLATGRSRARAGVGDRGRCGVGGCPGRGRRHRRSPSAGGDAGGGRHRGSDGCARRAGAFESRWRARRAQRGSRSDA
jgi:hypothetical protein